MSTTLAALVISGCVSLGFGLLAFLAKQQFADIKGGIDDTRKKMDESNHQTGLRIEKLEEKTDREIGNLKQELSDVKGDFATTFVLREDFFRSMNSVEDKMKSIDNKIDKLLLKNGNE